MNHAMIVQPVLKVFKKGTFLRHLKSQLPQGLLQFCAAERKNWRSPTPKVFPRYQCEVYCGTLLEDGRFAFLMVKEHFDLRSLIGREMKSKGGEGGGPFSKEEAEVMMYSVALGVESLSSLLQILLIPLWIAPLDVAMKELPSANFCPTSNVDLPSP